MPKALGIKQTHAGLWRSKGSSSNLVQLLGNPKAAISFARRVSINYRGPLLEVRRSSDNSTKEIRYTLDGVLDQEQLLNFVGTGAQDDGFVSVAFDQSGNSSDIVEPQASVQGKIVNAGSVITKNGHPAVDTGGVNCNYELVNTFQALDSTVFFVVTFNSANTAHLLSSGNPNVQLRRNAGSLNYAASGNQWNGGATGNNILEDNTNTGLDTQYIITVAFLNEINTWINGVKQGLTATRVNDDSVPFDTVAARPASTNFADILLQEFALSEANDTPKQGAIANDMNLFYGAYV